MNLAPVEISRVGARERALEYSRAAKQAKTARERQEFEQIARAYRVAARDDVALISLTRTIAAGDTIVRTRVWNKGLENERRQHSLLPKLAACRWDAAFCYSLGVQRDGAVEFIDALGRGQRYQKGRLRLDAGTFELPDGFEAGHDVQWTYSGWSAMVPIVPPRHRPARGMGDLLVLWEVEQWAWATVPPPPGDPALLRHVAGDIYAVVATWDLTELEKLVLSGRRREAW